MVCVQGVVELLMLNSRSLSLYSVHEQNTWEESAWADFVFIANLSRSNDIQGSDQYSVQSRSTVYQRNWVSLCEIIRTRQMSSAGSTMVKKRLLANEEFCYQGLGDSRVTTPSCRDQPHQYSVLRATLQRSFPGQRVPNTAPFNAVFDVSCTLWTT